MNNNSLCQIHGVMSVMYVVTKNRFLNYCCNKAAAFIQRQKTSGFYYQDSTIHLIHRPSSSVSKNAAAAAANVITTVSVNLFKDP
jgi:hypothetical protein